MNTDRKIHRQGIFDITGLLPKRNWKTAMWHIALLVIVVFLTEISGAYADMVFDFQMKLAQKGNAEAQFKVGEMYETGRGVEQNLIEAKRWINKAAAQGNEAAGYKLLYYDLQNNGVTADNKEKLAELQTAAKNGNGYAQYYVGLMHSRGVGLRKSNSTALDWLGKASLVGVTVAEAEIARVNEASQGAQLRAKQEAEKKARAQQEAQRQSQEAKRKEEERRKLEAQRQAEQRKQQEVSSKKKAEQDKKRVKQREAERAAAEKEAQKLRLIAQREAEAEQKRKAVMEQRKKKEADKKAKFESDPCAGKSARFLSTCR